MRVAVACLAGVATYLLVTWLLRRFSSVLREIDRRHFARVTMFYSLAFASGAIWDYAVVSRWSWSELLLSQVLFGAFMAPMMAAGQWVAARMMRWARTGR